MAYVPPGNAKSPPFLWLCEDPTCIKLGKTVFHMTAKQLSAHEGFALADAGDEAGKYLEEVGKSDLGDLSREQWLRFLEIVLTSYSDKMRERLLNNVAPF